MKKGEDKIMAPHTRIRFYIIHTEYENMENNIQNRIKKVEKSIIEQDGLLANNTHQVAEVRDLVILYRLTIYQDRAAVGINEPR